MGEDGGGLVEDLAVLEEEIGASLGGGGGVGGGVGEGEVAEVAVGGGEVLEGGGGERRAK